MDDFQEHMLRILESKIESSLLEETVEAIMEGFPDKNTKDKISPDIDYSGLTVLIYSNDEVFRENASTWVKYKANVNRTHYHLHDKLKSTISNAKFVRGAKSASIEKLADGLGGYTGELDGVSFDQGRFESEIYGNVVVVNYGMLQDVDYKHYSNDSYGFIFAVKRQGYNGGEIHGRPILGHISLMVLLPRQLYQSFVKNELRDVDNLFRGVLPEQPWQEYLEQGGFFTNPRIIGEVSK